MRMTYSHGNAARINLFDVLLYIHVSLKEYSLRSSSDRATALARGGRREGEKLYISVPIITRAYDVARHYSRLARFSGDLHVEFRARKKKKWERGVST